ncbi:hypothetical protein PG995_015888 [Apiospora arundinis]
METTQIANEERPHEAYAKRNNEVLEACVMCEKKGDLACNVCGTKYCSKQCQKQDWKYHKMLCKSSMSADYRLSSRPGPDYRRIIVFPVDQKQPVWDWARFEGGPAGFAASEYHRLVPCPSDKFVHMGMPLNVSSSNPYMRFGRGLQVFAIGEIWDGIPSACPSLPINQSILNLAKPGHAQLHWGPFAVAAFSSDEIGRPIIDRGIILWEDATLKDLRLVVDDTIAGKLNPCVVDPDRYALKSNTDDKPWPALKLNCRGDMKRFGLRPADAIEEVQVAPVANPAGRERHDASLPSRLGLSWVWEFSSTNGSLQGEDLTTEENLGLILDKRPEVRDPENGGLFTGTLILMHKKGRHICREHLQAVVGYTRFVVARVPEGDSAALPVYRYAFTPEMFAMYWDEHWGNSGVPSPYLLEY